jgi:membrane associated rhomboid family serine protease
MNLLLWWAMNGQLAWQTHLGGFMIGWITAILIDPRARDVDT